MLAQVSIEASPAVTQESVVPIVAHALVLARLAGTMVDLVLAAVTAVAGCLAVARRRFDAVETSATVKARWWVAVVDVDLTTRTTESRTTNAFAFFARANCHIAGAVVEACVDVAFRLQESVLARRSWCGKGQIIINGCICYSKIESEADKPVKPAGQRQLVPFPLRFSRQLPPLRQNWSGRSQSDPVSISHIWPAYRVVHWHSNLDGSWSDFEQRPPFWHGWMKQGSPPNEPENEDKARSWAWQVFKAFSIPSPPSHVYYMSPYWAWCSSSKWRRSRFSRHRCLQSCRLQLVAIEPK